MTHMQELSDKNFQATIKIPQKVKANTIKYKKLKSLSKEIKYIKKKQRAILELKNIKLKRKKKKKTLLNGPKSRIEMAEKSLSELEDRSQGE